MTINCLSRLHSTCTTCGWDLFRRWLSSFYFGTRSDRRVWPVWPSWPSCCLCRPGLESSSACSGGEQHDLTFVVWSFFFFANTFLGKSTIYFNSCNLYKYFAGVKLQSSLTTESASWTRWCLASGLSRCTPGRSPSPLWSLRSEGKRRQGFLIYYRPNDVLEKALPHQSNLFNLFKVVVFWFLFLLHM